MNENDVKYRYGGGAYAQGPNTSGLRIWHVDNRVVYVNSNNVDRYGNISISEANVTANVLGNYTYGVFEAFSNTYYDSSDEYNADRISPLGRSYADYNVLQLIRNNTNETYRPRNSIKSTDLFTTGSSFSVDKYSKQFVKGRAMNDGVALPFTATVQSTSNDKCVVQIVKK